MVALRAFFLLGLILFAGTISLTPAQNARPAQDDKEVVDSTATTITAGKSVDFRQQLGLPYNSLRTLGTRIDAARRDHDPVSLAHTANELAVAEKVSGKKADISAQLLLKESAQLAKMRHQQQELEAVLKVSEQIGTTQDNLTLLQNEIAFAKKQAAQDINSRNQNIDPTGPRVIVVNNYSSQYIDLFLNGNYKVQILPGMSQSFTLDQLYNPVVLTAYGNADVNTWGPRYIWGTFKKYTWNIR